MDIADPFPHIERGNKYLCVVMDYFSKLTEVCSLPNNKAEIIAQFFMEMFMCLRVPEKLYSDQEREFESWIFDKCCSI